MWDKFPRVNRKTYWVEERAKTSFLEVFITGTLGLVFLCNGLAMSFMCLGPTMLAQDPDFQHVLTREERFYIGSSTSLAALVGMVLVAPVMYYLGRYKTSVFLGIPHLVGWLLIAFAIDFPMFVCGRVFQGIAVGMSVPLVPLYVTECVREKRRGFFVSVPYAMEALGMMFGHLILPSLGWKIGSLAMTGFPILLFIVCFFLPESPTWLLSKDREQDASEVLKKLRGEGREEKVRKEVDDFADSLERTQESWGNKSMFKVFCEQGTWWSLCLVICLMIFQQTTGFNSVFHHTGHLLGKAKHMVNISHSKDTSSISPAGTNHLELDHDQHYVVMSAVQTVVIALAACIVDRVGKKVLLIVSAVVIVLAHVGLGIFFHYGSLGQSLEAFQCSADWVVYVFLYALIVGYSLGYAVLPYAIMSEVFPVQLSSFLAPITTLVNYAYGFILVRYFGDAISDLPPGCIFWTFAVVTTFSLLLIIFGVPETKGKTLSQLQGLFHPEWNVLDAEKDKSFGESTFNQNIVNDIFHNRSVTNTDYLNYR